MDFLVVGPGETVTLLEHEGPGCVTHVYGALAFPELVPAEPEHPNTEPMNRVRDALRDWDKPTLVVWGADDRVLPLREPHDGRGEFHVQPVVAFASRRA